MRILAVGLWWTNKDRILDGTPAVWTLVVAMEQMADGNLGWVSLSIRGRERLGRRQAGQMTVVPEKRESDWLRKSKDEENLKVWECDEKTSVKKKKKEFRHRALSFFTKFKKVSCLISPCCLLLGAWGSRPVLWKGAHTLCCSCCDANCLLWDTVAIFLFRQLYQTLRLICNYLFCFIFPQLINQNFFMQIKLSPVCYCPHLS